MSLKRWKIGFNDSDDLAFVIWVLSCDAIDLDEFRQWVLKVVSEVEDPPLYFFDLIDFRGYQKDITAVLGFVPEWEPSAGELNAIFGLAYLRDIQPREAPPREKCLASLRKHADIYQRYLRAFPGVILPEFPS